MPHPLLDKLGIRPEVQDFFAPYHNDLKFSYGTDFEHYSENFHRIPLTENVWIAGVPELASDIFICGSAMDALAYSHISTQFAFIAVGVLPSFVQIENLPKRRFHLIFANDILGAACDLKVASHLRRQPLTIRSAKSHCEVRFRNQTYLLEKLSLSALEKASGYRFGIRTHKPKTANTWTSLLNHRRSLPLSGRAPT